MIKNNPAERVVNAVINIIAALPFAHGFADDARNRSRRRRHQKTSRLGKDLNILREQSLNLRVNFLRKLAEWLHVLVVMRRETAADIENLELVSARPGFLHHRRGDIQRLHKVLKIRALATDVKTQSLDHKSQFKCCENQIHRLARIAPELVRQL